MKRLVSLVCIVFLATAVVAGSGGGGGGNAGMGGSMDRNLFPPEFILKNQVALGLSPDQVAAIKKQVGSTQGDLLDPKVELSRVTEQLRAALEGAKVDESAALALATEAMDLEKKVKTAHLGLMIRVKNVLTEEQQNKARALRPQRRAGQRDGATE